VENEAFADNKWTDAAALAAIDGLLAKTRPHKHASRLYFVHFSHELTGRPLLDGDNIDNLGASAPTRPTGQSQGQGQRLQVRAEIRLTAKGLRVDMETPISRARQTEIASCPQHDPGGEANARWLAYRVGRVTGSPMGAICGTNPHSSPTKQLVEFLWSSFKGNVATRWGNLHEKDCEAAFQSFQQSRLLHGGVRGVCEQGHALNEQEAELGQKLGPEQGPEQVAGLGPELGPELATGLAANVARLAACWDSVLEPGFELVDVQFENKGLCLCRAFPFLAMSPDGFLVETYRKRTEHASREAAQAAMDAAPRTVLRDSPRPVPVTATLSEKGSASEGALQGTVPQTVEGNAQQTLGSNVQSPRFYVVLEYVLRVLVEYKCPYKQRGRVAWMGDLDIYPVENIQKVPGLRLPVPSYYYTQVQYGCQLLGVLDDLLTWPTHCWVVVWAPAALSAPTSPSPPATSTTTSTTTGTATSTATSSTTSTTTNTSSTSCDDDNFADEFDDAAFSQPLRTALSGEGASLNVQTEHGTIQITRVQFHPGYAAAAVNTAIQFWKTRYLPGLWQKQNGFLAEGELPIKDEGHHEIQALLQRRIQKRQREERERQVVTLHVNGTRPGGTKAKFGAGSKFSAGSKVDNKTFSNTYITIDDVDALGGRMSKAQAQAEARAQTEAMERELAEEFGDGFQLE
jgi:hypothetical protein